MPFISESSYYIPVAKYDFFFFFLSRKGKSCVSQLAQQSFSTGSAAPWHEGDMRGFSVKYEDTAYQALCKHPRTRPSLL